ncbi:hypothetical protein [Magnetococcus sp. PR-3]|uniref:hypothetical protein n=1 Tax=Magnetococcus sp. PR-3 TaxID=3120355 RepID=UPI002FCE1620
MSAFFPIHRQTMSKGCELTMQTEDFSKKGQKLIEMYTSMAKDGYLIGNGAYIESAFNDFSIRAYRTFLKPYLVTDEIQSLLDYGCGGSNWQQSDFDEESAESAQAYFKLQKVCYYEPGRQIDQRQKVDAVISFDVLEHVFIADIPKVLNDIFSYANKLVILNVACYPANARLPNGENAHITVRPAQWWKGMVDSIALQYPDIHIFLICSDKTRKSANFPLYRAGEWLQSEQFCIP